MTLVSLIYEMSNVLRVMREWTVNKLKSEIDIDAVIFNEWNGLLLLEILSKAWVFITI